MTQTAVVRCEPYETDETLETISTEGIDMSNLDIFEAFSVESASGTEVREARAAYAARPFFSFNANRARLYHAEALELLRCARTESVDVIFADPPYFLSNNGVTCQSGRMVSVNKGQWDMSKGPAADFEFNKAWLSECQRILKQDGTLWVSGTLHNIYAIGFAMQMLGYKILNDIAWYKINPPPNLSCRYFTHATETLLWAKKNDSVKHKFNYELMKKENQGRQMQSLWQITPPKPREKHYGKHPTQKPEDLLRRIIVAASNPGDLILDPFVGSGTTGVVSVRLGRRFIGIDACEEYLNVAKSRIGDAITEILDGSGR